MDIITVEIMDAEVSHRVGEVAKVLGILTLKHHPFSYQSDGEWSTFLHDSLTFPLLCVNIQVTYCTNASQAGMRKIFLFSVSL